MSIDARRLLVLRAIHRAGGVGPAARALYLTPSGVSQHISRLEEETGLSLVDRSRRGGGRSLALTPAGLALAEHGDRLAEVLAAAEREAQALRGERHGPVRIGGFSTVLRRLVGPAIVDLSISEPGIAPTVTEIEQDAGLDALRAGELDLVLIDRAVGAALPRGVVVEDLMQDRYRVVLPSSWVGYEDPETLLRGPWVSGRRGTPARVALEALAGGEPLDVRHVCEEFTSMLALTGAGLGATIITDLVLDFLPLGNTFVSTGPLDPGARLISVAHRRGRAEPGPAATAMLDALRAHAHAT